VSKEPRDGWRRFYRAALVEVDSAKLRQRIDQAYAAIQGSMSKDGVSVGERHAQADALANLRVLRTEVERQETAQNDNEPESSSSGQQ
jgi:hypothetical protein